MQVLVSFSTFPSDRTPESNPSQPTIFSQRGGRTGNFVESFFPVQKEEQEIERAV
jgi:hypothetical protein